MEDLNTKKTLEIGDKVYRCNMYEVYTVETVVRVTDTQAVTNKYKFKRRIGFNNSLDVIPASSEHYSRYSWKVETRELKDQLHKQIRLGELKKIDLNSLSIEKIESILEIIQ